MFLAKAIAVIATSPSLKLTFVNRFLRYGPKIQVYDTLGGVEAQYKLRLLIFNI